MKHALTSSLFLFSLVVPAFGQAPAQPAKPAAPAPAAEAPVQLAADVVKQQKPAYPLTTCVVCGSDLAAASEAVDHVANQRLLRLCGKGCIAAADKDAAAAIKKVDAAVIAAQKPGYPLATCPLSGEKLGADAVDHVHGTRLVRLSNAAALASFAKDPNAALAKVDKALIDAQLPGYKPKVCIVSNEPYDGMGAPVDYLYGTKLVRFCCKPCIRTFEKKPETYMKELAKLQ